MKLIKYEIKHKIFCIVSVKNTQQLTVLFYDCYHHLATLSNRNFEWRIGGGMLTL